jgi:hypothetical protein
MKFTPIFKRIGLAFLFFVINCPNINATPGDIYYADLKDGGHVLYELVISTFVGSRKYYEYNVSQKENLHAIDVIRNYYYAELNLEDPDIAQLSIKAIDINGRTLTVQKFTGIQMRNGTSLVIMWNRSSNLEDKRWPGRVHTALGYNQDLANRLNRNNINFTITENFQFTNGKIKSSGFKSQPSKCNWLAPREYSKINPITRNRPTLSSQTTFKKYTVGDKVGLNYSSSETGTIWKISLGSRPSVFAYAKGNNPNSSLRSYCTSSVNAPDGWRVATKQELLEIALFKKSQNELDFKTYYGPDYAVNMVLCREVKGVWGDYNNWYGNYYWVKDLESRKSNSNDNYKKTKKKSTESFDLKQTLSDLRQRVATKPLVCRRCKRFRNKIIGNALFITLDASGLSVTVNIEAKREKRADRINRSLTGCIMSFMSNDILRNTASSLYRNLPVRNKKQSERLIMKHRRELTMEILYKIKETKSKTHSGEHMTTRYTNKIYQTQISEILFNFLKENYSFSGSEQDVKFAVYNSFSESDSEKGYEKVMWWLSPGFWARLLSLKEDNYHY